MNNNMEQPKFRHHPGDMIYLGHAGDCDLYVNTPGMVDPFLVARHGSDYNEYVIWKPYDGLDLIVYEHIGAFPMAFCLAKAKGYFNTLEIGSNVLLSGGEHISLTRVKG